MFIKLFVFSVLLHNVVSQSLTSDNGNAVVKCVIPPLVLKNGNLTLRGFIFKQSSTTSPVAGDEVKTYVLRATCDPGYERIGSAEVTCPPEDDEVMPECLPICKRQNSEVLTCSAPSDDRVAQCVIPDDGFGSLQLTKGVRWRKNLKCGVANTVSASVAGGRKAGETDVPWHVSVYTKKTQPFMQTCGGTLVSAKLVVSAAHCFWSDLTKKQPAADYAVAVAKLYRPWNDENDVNAQKSDVQEIRIPPRFQGGTTNFQDDIALLITTNAFQFNDFVTPACLDFDYNFDTTQTADGNLARVAGFGLTGQDAGASPVLNMVEMPTVGIEKCISSSDPGFLVSITSDKICAGFKNGTAVCRGDSGGGLAVPSEVEVSFHYFLRGVVSSAPKNNHSCNVFALATFTHIIKHEHFIKQALEDAANLKTSPITTEPTFNIGIIEPTQKAIVEQPSVDQNRVDQAAEDRNTVDLAAEDRIVVDQPTIDQIISKKSIIDEEKNNMADSETTTEEYVYKEPIFRSLATGKRIFLREIPKSEQAESNKKISDNIQEIIDNNNATKKVSNANTAEIPTEIISKILSGIDQPKPTNKSPLVQNLKIENNPVNIPSAEAQKNEKFCKEFLEKNKNQAPNDKHWCNHYDFNYNYHHEYHYDYPNVQYQYQIPNNNQNSPLSPQNQPNVQLSNQNAQNSQLSNQNVQLNQNAQIGHVNGQNVVLNNQVPNQSNAQNGQSNKNVQFAQNAQNRPTNGQNPEVIYQNVMFIPQNTQSNTQSPQLSIQNVEPNNEIPPFIALNGQNPQIIEISQPNTQLGNQNVIFNNQNAQLRPPHGQTPQIFFENIAFNNQNPLSQQNVQNGQLSNQNVILNNQNALRPPNGQTPQVILENVAFNNQNPLSQQNVQNGQLSNQNVQLNNRFAEISPSNGQQPQSNYQNVAFNQQNTQVSHPNDYSAQFSKQNLDVNERNAQIIHPNGENTQAVQQNVDFNHRGAQVSRPNPQNAQLGYQELQLNKQNSQISHSNGQNAQLSHQNVDFLAQNSQTSEQNGQNHHSHHNVHLYHHDTQYNYQNPPVQFDNKNIQVYY